MAIPPSADSLALLASLYVPPFLVQVRGLPHSAGWRLEHSEDDGITWASLEPGQPGHPTPAEAIEAGANLIASWREARVDASNAEIAYFFSNGKLDRRKIRVADPNNPDLTIEVDGYAALNDEGIWVESISPIEAINKAKVKPIKLSGVK